MYDMTPMDHDFVKSDIEYRTARIRAGIQDRRRRRLGARTRFVPRPARHDAVR